MKHVKKSVLLWYSAHEIYELVIDVEAYPKFLPWCERAEVLERNADGLTARLHLAYAGLRHAFTTRNVQVADQSVQVGAGRRPVLAARRPVALRAAAGAGRRCESGHGQRLQDRVRHALRLRQRRCSRPSISPVFDRIANTFVDSFVRRAEQVHGPR